MPPRKAPSKSALDSDISPQDLIKYTGWVLLAGAWMMVALSLISYDPADWPGHSVAPYNTQPHNWIGQVGAILAHHVYLMIGPGVWVLMAGALALLVATARQKPITQLMLRVVGVIIMTLVASALVGLSLPGVTRRPEGSGGLISIYINCELTRRFNTLGTMIILGIGFWLGAILAVDHIVMAIPRYVANFLGVMPKIHIPSPVLVGRFPMPRSWGRADDPDPDDEDQTPVARAAAIDGPIDEDAGGLGGTEPFNPDEHKVKDAVDTEVMAEVDEDDDENISGGDAPGAYVAEKRQSRSRSSSGQDQIDADQLRPQGPRRQGQSRGRRRS